MSNRVEYRFRCKKKSSYVNIAQTSVTISRLRELIMKNEHLDQQPDITLVIKNAQTGKTYKDPTEIVYRSTSVIVSRLPLSSLDEKVIPEAGAQEQQQKLEQVMAPVNTILDQQDIQLEREQKKFFFGQKDMPRSFVLRPTQSKVILPYGEAACFQRTDEPPLSETRWSLEDLQRWLCPICHRLLIRATSTQCCPTAYCNTCITEALLADEHQKCPNCNRVNTSPLDLREERQLRDELAAWQKYDPMNLRQNDEAERMRASRQHDASDDDDDSRGGRRDGYGGQNRGRDGPYRGYRDRDGYGGQNRGRYDDQDRERNDYRRRDNSDPRERNSGRRQRY